MRFLVAVALMALIASPSVAGDRDAELIVTRQVASIVPPDGAGGVAVALRIDGRSLFFNYGWADRANKRPITTDTLFLLDLLSASTWPGRNDRFGSDPALLRCRLDVRFAPEGGRTADINGRLTCATPDVSNRSK